MPSVGDDLRKIPLVARMLDDPEVRLVERATDQDWSYSGCCASATGWNPWASEIYIGVRSVMSDWLRDPAKELRVLNEGDLLVPEVLFSTHDYLHAWAVRVVQELVPEWRLGYGPITRENVESLAFLSLLTEAVATVGLDYWYLSCTDIDHTLQIGTRLRTLTTSYLESDLEEHRRAHPALSVQDPSFFLTIARLYLTGVMSGFTNDALKLSPKTFVWLQKELRYAAEQRSYARSWLEHLAGQGFYGKKSELQAPVDCEAVWQRELIERMGELLWKLVKLGDFTPTPPSPTKKSWQAPQFGPIDCRFTNLSRFADPASEVKERGIVAESFPCFFSQVLSSLRFDQCGQRLSPCLSAVKEARSPALVFELVRHYPRLEPDTEAPLDMFFLG